MADVLAPDGKVYDIPPDQLQNALNAGGKTASRVFAPDKTVRWVPNESLGDAQKAGGIVIPGIKPLQNPITQEIGKRATAGLAGVPGGAPQVAPATPAYEAAVGLPLAAAATVMGGSVAAPLAIAGGKAVVSHVARNPIKYSLGIEAARQLPYVGDKIPSWAAMVPFLLGGGKAAAVPAAEAAAESGMTPIQKWWAERKGVFTSERPTGPIHGPGPQPRPQPTPSATTPPPAPSSAASELQFPPPQAKTQFVEPSRYQMQQEEAGLQQQIRADLEAHGRNAALEEGRIRRAASTVDVPKSTLIERARAGAATYTQGTPPATKSAAVVPKTREETMRLMKESIKLAAQRKGRIQ